MSNRTAPGRTEVGYRLSRRRFLVTSGALVAAAACTTTPVRAPSGGVTEGTVKLTAWTIGPDAPSYYRRDNLIAAGETLGKAVAAKSPKTSIQVDATFESGGRWGGHPHKIQPAPEGQTAAGPLLPAPQEL